MVWFDLVWFCLVSFDLVWFYLVWFGLVWFRFGWFRFGWFRLVGFVCLVSFGWFRFGWFCFGWFRFVWFRFANYSKPRSTTKSLNCLKPEKLDPINLFVTGGAGAGKSHLIKAIYHTAVKTFRYGAVNPEKPTVALMAPTGVAAININGTAIRTALSILKESGDFAPKMSDQKGHS